MLQITDQGRTYIDRPQAACAAWVRADAVANYERFQRRFVSRQAQPLPPA